MAKDEKSLADAMQEMMGKGDEESPNQLSGQKVSEETGPELKPNSRHTKKHIGGYFDMTVWQQWSYLRIEQDGRSTQDLLEEAVGDLFEKYGKSIHGSR